MSESAVTVTQSASGEWFRMEYKGSVDYLPADATSPEGPTEGEKRIFRDSVDRRRVREDCNLNTQGHESQVQRVG